MRAGAGNLVDADDKEVSEDERDNAQHGTRKLRDREVRQWLCET